MNINMMAVLAAVAANFVFGFIWYTPLFGKAWAKEMGYDMSVKPTGGAMAKGMILMIIGNFFLAFVFAHNIAAWSYVPGTSEMSPMSNLMSAVGFTWLGFYLPGDLSRVGWEKASLKLFAINTGYHFGMLLVSALILTNM